ncbi:hypothetical protein GCM10025787_54520 [Saccharopolyspora rosea]|nr:hypothetical protein [Saccharopolyspora rosea]
MFRSLGELNCRERSALRAVAAGRAGITCSSEPDLYIDGMVFCDQETARRLWHGGLVRAARPGRLGELVPAELTEPAVEALELGAAPRPVPERPGGDGQL